MKLRLLLLFIVPLWLAFLNAPEGKSPYPNLPFEDLQPGWEDPSLSQQEEAIRKNGIRTCQIRRWGKSPEEDTLQLEPSTTNIWYNQMGQVDSLVEKSFHINTVINSYNQSGALAQRKVITEAQYPEDVEGRDLPQKRVLTSSFEYDIAGKMIRENIVSSFDPIDLDIQFEWKEKDLVSFTIDDKKKGKMYRNVLTYEGDHLVKRVIYEREGEVMKVSRTHDFIYKGEQLAEITNTWSYAQKFEEEFKKYSQQMPHAKLAELTNTRFTYYSDGKLETLSRSRGQWPNQTYNVTTFQYRKDGLIDYKEITNSGPQGMIITRYQYQYE